MQTLLQIGHRIERAAQKVKAHLEGRTGKIVRWTVPILLLAVLAHQLAQIGWPQVWAARPVATIFYLVLPLPFFVQPLGDLVIYRMLWKSLAYPLRLSVLLRKGYLNSVMLEYSGEAYFYFWAQRHLKLGNRDLLHAIKDTNVLSGGAGLAMAWVMLLVLVVTGAVGFPAFLSGKLWALVTAGSIPLVLCLILISGGRRVTVLSRSQIATTFAIHLTRSAAVLALDFVLFRLSGAMPSALVCLEFVALRILVTRLPLVPNKDLLFVGVGIEAARFMDISVPGVAAVLITTAAFDQILGFAVVGMPWLLEQFPLRRKNDRVAT